MDFMSNVKGMFGEVNFESEQEKVFKEANKTLKLLEDMEKFFNSESGKLLLGWIENIKLELYEKLENVSTEDLLKVQADLKALKAFTEILKSKEREKEYLINIIEGI